MVSVNRSSTNPLLPERDTLPPSALWMQHPIREGGGTQEEGVVGGGGLMGRERRKNRKREGREGKEGEWEGGGRGGRAGRARRRKRGGGETHAPQERDPPPPPSCIPLMLATTHSML